MSATGVLAKNGSISAGAPRWASEDLARRATLAFIFLFLFLFVLYGRPLDYFMRTKRDVLAKIPTAMPFAIAACTAYGFALLRGLSLIWTREMTFMTALTFWFIAGVPFAHWKSNSLDYLKDDWLKILIIFFLMSQVICTLGRVKKILWLIIFCMFFTCAATLLLRADVALSENRRLVGVTYGVFRGNYLGIAMGFVLPYMAAFMLRSRKLMLNLYLVLAFALAMRYVILSASRSNLIVALFTLGVVWLMMLRHSRRANILVAFMVCFGVFSILTAPDTFWNRFRALWHDSSQMDSRWGSSAAQSQEERLGLLIRSIQFSVQNPLFGVGVRNFSVVSGSTTGDASEWKGTHNTYTQFTSEAGIPSLIIVILMLTGCVKAMRKIQQDFAGVAGAEDLHVLSRATEVSIVSFAISGMFAHFGYEYYLYQVLAIGVALQTVAAQMRLRLADGSLVKTEPEKGNGVGKSGGTNGKKGRRW